MSADPNSDLAFFVWYRMASDTGPVCAKMSRHPNTRVGDKPRVFRVETLTPEERYEDLQTLARRYPLPTTKIVEKEDTDEGE